MTRKTLKFNNIRVNKTESHMPKKPINLMSVNVNKIVVSDKFNYNEDGLFKDNEVGEQYEQIWGVIKNKLGIKFYSNSIYEQKYFKTKVREYDGAIKTSFLGNSIRKENMHSTCIACITIDSVMRMDKKNYLQVYLEDCKHKIKKMSRFINTELKSDSKSDDDQLKSDSGNDFENDSHK